eukprot:CAMPEP_0119566072 /NCGR_PEP_ID=MMETSP1352-20130426/31995_1 /TAXON_ID=265584 /ORGANISM="Stauroneis constricta, Strain CCMP1120" /LENGTH=581 /DNA_ID=CAMNT_0007615119 /DNA_START=416 /DNA_END=2161 /DNA_ORIENTATION=+
MSTTAEAVEDYNNCVASSGGATDALLVCVTSRLSQLEEQVAATSQSTTTQAAYSRDVFLVLSAALVFYMQAGFAMVCAGAVRRKNLQNTMLKNLLDACGSALSFWSVGYAFAFGDGAKNANAFIGTTNFFLMDVDDLAFWVFQYAFSAAAVTIVAGTLAERCKMKAYFLYSVFLSGWVYPIVVHSIWSGEGFLSPSKPGGAFLDVGVIDFAGSGVVHLTGGVTALVATHILGSRRGRFYDEVTGEPLEVPMEIRGHSISLQMIGTMILWFAWYGFNAGSALLFDVEEAHLVAATAAVTTTLAAGTGGIAALGINMLAQGIIHGESYYDIPPAMNGALSGLVAITAGCGVVDPWASVVIGFFAGVFYLFGSWILIQFRLDDAVNAIPVHMFNGIWGMLAVGLFATPRQLEQAYGNGKHPGLLYAIFERQEMDANLLCAQLVGCLFIMAWTVALMFPFFWVLSTQGLFRSLAKDEVIGLDKSFHGGIENTSGMSARQMLFYKSVVDEALRTGELAGEALSPADIDDLRKSAQMHMPPPPPPGSMMGSNHSGVVLPPKSAIKQTAGNNMQGQEQSLGTAAGSSV